MAKHSMSDAPTTKEPSYKRPKIRESCNHCSSQKIRCTKERPACGRCVNKGLDCRYNISRRTGTRRQSIQGTPEPENSQDAKPASGTITSGLEPPSTSCDFSAPDEFSSYSDSMWMMDPSFSQGLDSTTQYFDAFGEGNRDSSDHVGKMAIETQITSMSGQEMETLFGIATSYVPGMEAVTAAQVSTSPTPPAPFRTGSKSGSRHHGHGCISTALAIFSELHVSSPACTVSASGLDDVRDFDHVLDCNRDALARLATVLDCPCCNDQEVLTAAFLTIDKALSWYSAALNVDTGVEPGSPSGRVSSPQAFIGSYALDSQCLSLARAYVVMAQLQEHLHPLMTKLQERSCRPAPVSRASSTTSLSSSTSAGSRASCSAVVDSQKRALQDTLDGIVARVDSIKRGSR